MAISKVRAVAMSHGWRCRLWQYSGEDLVAERKQEKACVVRLQWL